MGIAESVWEYPRPPRLERTASHLSVVHRGVCVANTRHGLRVLETSHPPVFYFPPGDVRMDLLRQSDRGRTHCEWKGVAEYWSLTLAAEESEPPLIVQDIAWSYPEPTLAFAGLRNYLAFYPGRVDECRVDGERVQAQAGDFYGGWVTSRVLGPFKGGPGTRGW